MVSKAIKLYKKYEEVINYLIIGGLTTVVSLGIYYGCVYTFLDPNDPVELQIANFLSAFIAIIFAYFTNRKYVFKSKETNKLKEATKFASSRLFTMFLDMFIMFIGVSVFHLNDKIFKIISQVLVVVGNYIISKFLVFRKK